MAENAGDLTFRFGADFSGFTRAVDGAGHKLDQLTQAATRWGSGTSGAVSRSLDGAMRGPLSLTGGMQRAALALRSPPAAATTASDDATTKELGHLADQLALLKTTGAAHDAIVERMKVETEQAKLGTDATDAQKQAVAGLVAQIGAAKAAQAALKTEQTATNEAWTFGADEVERGLQNIILHGGRLQDVARSLLSSFASHGLSAALTGSGSLAGLFGTQGKGGQTGGLFGALQTLLSGGLSGSGGGGGLFSGLFGQAASADSSFSGLYANGGTIGSGQWGIVGEQGAEVVAGPATVVPWSKVAARGASDAPAAHQTINFNVTSPDAPSFARSEGQMAALLSRAAARGQRNL